MRKSTRRKWRVLTSQVTTWSIPDNTVVGSPVDGNGILPYLIVTCMVAGLTVLFWKIGYAFTLVNLALLYLLPVMISSVRWGLDHLSARQVLASSLLTTFLFRQSTGSPFPISGIVYRLQCTWQLQY
ncbi:hypothetical protein [Alicyclobacillus fastidiosus]|uniref:hypothetical protein n=1 Tax=Alicyclobacillus fastidiosus TaxID=392011 RepID=UPI0024E107EB|nr:hypothetical protein [Alicyclobacillus fastidiosus]